MTVPIVRRAAADLGLPAWYDSVPTYACDTPLHLDDELTAALAGLTRANGRRPTVVFTDPRPATLPALGNPYPRRVLSAALGLAADDGVAEIVNRLTHDPAEPTGAPAEPGGAPIPPAPGTRRATTLDDLPAPRHRPGDRGRYLTAAVTVTRPPGSGPVNLGCYRAYLAGPNELRIFLNPRSDGHANAGRWHEQGRDMPVAMFLGAHPVHALIGGAGRWCASPDDDYAVVSRLIGRPPVLTGDPPVPADASCVIRGRLTPRLAAEGPFAEFKGYYEAERQSHVLEVDSVAAVPGAPLPFIVSGAESGMALTRIDSEVRLLRRLLAAGQPVRSVTYPAAGHGKYVALVETPHPTPALLDLVMEADPTVKFVVCGAGPHDPWPQLSAFPTEARLYPYTRRGATFGHRIGVLVRADPAVHWAEH